MERKVSDAEYRQFLKSLENEEYEHFFLSQPRFYKTGNQLFAKSETMGTRSVVMGTFTSSTKTPGVLNRISGFLIRYWFLTILNIIALLNLVGVVMISTLKK